MRVMVLIAMHRKYELCWRSLCCVLFVLVCNLGKKEAFCFETFSWSSYYDYIDPTTVTCGIQLFSNPVCPGSDVCLSSLTMRVHTDQTVNPVNLLLLDMTSHTADIARACISLTCWGCTHTHTHTHTHTRVQRCTAVDLDHGVFLLVDVPQQPSGVLPRHHRWEWVQLDDVRP